VILTGFFCQWQKYPQQLRKKLDQLLIDFQISSIVINHYRQDIALSQLTAERAFSSRPLLISGPPGVGKTAFCKSLANIMQTNFELIGMSGVTAVLFWAACLAVGLMV